MTARNTQDKLQTLVEKFAEDMAAVLTEAVHDGVQNALGTVKAGTKRSTSTKSKSRSKARSGSRTKRVANGVAVKEVRMRPSKTPTRRTKKKGQKRTPAQLKKDADRILKAIKADPGLRAEHLRDRLGIPTSDLQIPLRMLFEEGKIEYTGQLRATCYYPA